MAKKVSKVVQQDPEGFTVESRPQNEMEYLGDGISRMGEKQNPTDILQAQDKKRKSGSWVKVEEGQLQDLETKGLLIGYDPIRKEALIKEK